MRVPTGPKADLIPKGPKAMMVPSMAPVEPKAEKAKKIAMARYAERHIPTLVLPSTRALREGQKFGVEGGGGGGGGSQLGVGQTQGKALLEQQRKIMQGKKMELQAQMAMAKAKRLQEEKLKEKLGHSVKRLEECAKALAMAIQRLEVEKERAKQETGIVVKVEEAEVRIKREKTTETGGVEKAVGIAEKPKDMQNGRKRSLEEAMEEGELKQEEEVDFYASDRWAMDMLRNARKKTRHEQLLDGPF